MFLYFSSVIFLFSTLLNSIALEATLTCSLPFSSVYYFCSSMILQWYIRKLLECFYYTPSSLLIYVQIFSQSIKEVVSLKFIMVLLRTIQINTWISINILNRKPETLKSLINFFSQPCKLLKSLYSYLACAL